MRTLVLGLIALLALLPAAAGALTGRLENRAVFAGVLLLAAAGLGLRFGVLVSGPWPTGLAASLWISLGAMFLLFAALAVTSPTVRALNGVVLPWFVLMAGLALAWDHAPAKSLAPLATEWLPLHIVASVATYALVTLAALAAFAAVLQQRALKAKRPTPFTRRLPAVAACEAVTVRLLTASEVVLAFGVASGMALGFVERGTLLVLDHKTVLVLTAFVVIGVILIVHARSGMRGRAWARAVMAAWLLITLGYPGVKFVTDVLLA